jgi:hypothetical protein
MTFLQIFFSSAYKDIAALPANGSTIVSEELWIFPVISKKYGENAALLPG